MNLPKIALVGRPNVGKSALFNRICQKRLSIVEAQEGITRDRLYAEAEAFGRRFMLIDTGGIDSSSSAPFNQEIKRQAQIAIDEADAIILVTDGQVGLHPLDEQVAKLLLSSKKPLILAVNKIDRREEEVKIHQFHSLAIQEIIGVSASQGFQVAEALEKILEKLPKTEGDPQEDRLAIRVAIVGRPNVGKSTLLNQLLQEERSIVSPIAGTTRDAIDVEIEVEGHRYILIDTAGIRRKKAEKEVVDKFAAIRTEDALEKADVCLLVFDSYDGFTTQEKKIASDIEAKGKSCILLFNKWDLIKNLQMEHALRGVKEHASFLNHCPKLFISSLNLKNLRSYKVGGFRSTTIAPGVHPSDSDLLVLSTIEDGNSDIYELNIAGNFAKKLTKNPAIDTTPSYSPDGKYIAFASDREAGQQIYVMDVDGSSVKRISVAGGSYSKPVWSPDGKLIAFTKIKGGQFFIGVMSPNGKEEKLLTSGYLVEGAKWSPNGRYLIFSKKKGPYGRDSIPRLHIIDIVTGFEFEVSTPEGEGATDPDWGMVN